MRKIITLILLLIIAFCLSQCVFANDIHDIENIETNQQSNEHLESQNYNEEKTYDNQKNNKSSTIYEKSDEIIPKDINDSYDTSEKEYLVKNDDNISEYTINNISSRKHIITPVNINSKHKYGISIDNVPYGIIKKRTNIVVNYINTGKNEIEIRGKILDEKVKTFENQTLLMRKLNNHPPYINIPVKKDGSFECTFDPYDLDTDINLRSPDDWFASTGVDVPIKRIYSENIAYIGEKSNITITIPNQNYTVVNKGYCIFKINGLTLKDGYNNTIKRNIVDGKVLFDYLIPSNYKQRDYLLETVYVDNSNKFFPVRIIKNIHVINRNFELQINPGLNSNFLEIDYRKYEFKVALYKDNHTVDKGFVIFKINGVTIKDEHNQTLRYYLNPEINNNKSFIYQFPYHWSQKTVKITIIYNDITYGRIENSTYIQLWKTPIYMTVNTTLLKSRRVIVKGFINDWIKEYVTGTNIIGVKINGLTLKDKNGKVLYFRATDGRIDFNFTLPKEYKKDNYNITLVTGERSAYLGTNITTELRSKQ